ncbi:hypothetical protein BDW75DRAFT_242982 [Aspergillus navahoensis]
MPTTPDSASSLFEREKKCTITGASKVNCRAERNTSSTIKHKLNKGSSYTFDCFVTDEPVIIDGVSNASWQYIGSLGCYVNGHYTDSKCTSSTRALYLGLSRSNISGNRLIIMVVALQARKL